MVDNKAIIRDLEINLPALKERGLAGCSDAHVQWALGNAVLRALKMGYNFTDLDWFKGTTYYTGGRKLDQAA